jgi:serine/threonine protein kinase
VRKLGEGGFGSVYLAVKPTTQEVAALKVALPEVAAVPGQIERFQREILNNQSLRYPHIVRLFDNGYYQGVFFFTLEYCVGGSLDQLIRKRGAPLPVEEALPIILQVLEALEYAHNVELEVPQKNGEVKQIRGLVHRDLKPANILFTDEGTAKVADYGLAKAFDLAGLSGLTCTGEAAGTPLFCPRQQILDFKNCQPEVDVWAAAATLYFMLTGYPPRNFKEGEDYFKKVLTSQAIPMRDHNSSIPSRLAKVIDQALIDEPEIHFKAAKSFRKALQEAVS